MFVAALASQALQGTFRTTWQSSASESNEMLYISETSAWYCVFIVLRQDEGPAQHACLFR